MISCVCVRACVCDFEGPVQCLRNSFAVAVSCSFFSSLGKLLQLLNVSIAKGRIFC